MSIGAWVVLTVTFQKVDMACTQNYYQSLHYTGYTFEKCHKFLLCPYQKYSWWITGQSVMKNVDITEFSSKLHVHLQPKRLGKYPSQW